MSKVHKQLQLFLCGGEGEEGGGVKVDSHQLEVYHPYSEPSFKLLDARIYEATCRYNYTLHVCTCTYLHNNQQICTVLS